jgi:hypothetical protein
VKIINRGSTLKRLALEIVIFKNYNLFMKSDDDKFCTKIVELDIMYDFVIVKFFIWNLEAQNFVLSS